MNSEELEKLLQGIKNGSVSVEEGTEKIKGLHYKDLGYAKVDNHREVRVGYPEVIYCQGKTVDQVKGIVKFMDEKGSNILATRAEEKVFKAVKEICKDAKYNETAKIITVKKTQVNIPDTYITIVTGGTSDIPVAEEAAVTAEFLGNKVKRVYDAGVAGIHRLFDNMEPIRGAKVVIVAAGMEGALASVVGGLVDKPVIAVPTSVGYGANFGGLAALLSMLNSCASGVSVVNIDNGFGAGYLASIINKL